MPSGTPDSAEPRVGSSKPRSGAKMGTTSSDDRSAISKKVYFIIFSYPECQSHQGQTAELFIQCQIYCPTFFLRF